MYYHPCTFPVIPCAPKTTTTNTHTHRVDGPVERDPEEVRKELERLEFIRKKR